MENNYTYYNTLLFKDIYPEYESLLQDFQDSPVNECIKEQSLHLTYFLLMARYANNPIANMDKNQFKMKLLSIIFQYGPTWEKNLQLQKQLRDLSLEDIQRGSKMVYNHANNPSADPSTSALEELDYINDQNVTNYKKGIVESITILDNILKRDVTENYIKEFQKLFKTFINPERPILYPEEL